MFTKAVPKQVAANLALLSQSRLINDFYLAGGTACALQLGHRISYDLDFFTNQNFNPKQLATKLKDLNKFKLDKLAEGTLLASLTNVKISFFAYPYPLVFPFKKFKDLKVADYKDVACMKLDAIAARGTKRDFVDLYFILQEQKLADILTWFGTKYKGLQYNLTHLVKSLTYFEEAESEPMPEMLIDASWQQIKKYLGKETEKIAKSLIFK